MHKHNHRPTMHRGLSRPPSRAHGSARESEPTGEPEPPACTEDPPPDRDDRPILLTAEQAAELLQVRPSWLRRKAAARAVPCRFLGKHLRFTRSDIDAIAENSAHSPRAGT